MQQTQTNRHGRILFGIKGFFWVAGLLIAGSDSNFMPWVNGTGLLLFIASTIVLGKQNFHAESKTKAGLRFYQKSGKKEEQQSYGILSATSL